MIYRLIQFSEILLASAIVVNLLAYFSRHADLVSTIAVWVTLGLIASIGWVFWYLETEKDVYPQLSLIAVAIGGLIATWL